MYTLNRVNDFTNDSLFEDFFKQVNSRNTLLATNIEEKENGYEVEVEVPGIKKENIKISYENGYLTIMATYNKKEGKFLQKERVHGQFSRTYYIDGIDEDSINANLDNGILTISLSKAKKASQKFIEIK